MPVETPQTKKLESIDQDFQHHQKCAFDQPRTRTNTMIVFDQTSQLKILMTDMNIT